MFFFLSFVLISNIYIKLFITNIPCSILNIVLSYYPIKVLQQPKKYIYICFYFCIIKELAFVGSMYNGIKFVIGSGN